MSERIVQNEVAEIATSVRELVEVLEALHQMHQLPQPELKLFISLRNALTSYDARLSHD